METKWGYSETFKYGMWGERNIGLIVVRAPGKAGSD